MKYDFVKKQQASYPVTRLCRVMKVSRSAYYDWRQRGAAVVDSDTWLAVPSDENTVR